ncbi:hypothetical protein D3C81_765150 [compost metagenome]
MQVCDIHGCELISSSIPTAQRKNKHALYILDERAANLAIVRNENIPSYDSLLFISQQTNYLLNNDLNPIGLEKLHKFYKNELQKKGLVTALGDIRCVELRREFNDYYGEEFLRSMNSYIKSEENYSWLHKLCRKPRITCHPLRHMLLLHFLGREVNDIYENCTSSIQPFGSGPWMCLNKAAEHYKQPIITKCLVTRCSDTKKPVGTFTCECGFVYSRRGPDEADADMYRIGRIKSFGEVWRNKLLELSLLNLSLRQKAEILGVDPKTVVSQSEQLEHCKITIKSAEEGSIKEKYRLAWEGLIYTYVNEKIIDIRAKRPEVYRWLYNNDREWLLNYNLERRTKSGNLTSRVNWEGRDREIALKVENVCLEILADTSKTPRITTNEIGRRLLLLPLLTNRIQMLPKTQLVLKRFNETIKDYQIRRIKNNVRLIYRKEGMPKLWRVKRISGLKKEVSARYEGLIEEEILAVMANEHHSTPI